MSIHSFESQCGATAERSTRDREVPGSKLVCAICFFLQARELIGIARWPGSLVVLIGPSPYHCSPSWRAQEVGRSAPAITRFIAFTINVYFPTFSPIFQHEPDLTYATNFFFPVSVCGHHWGVGLHAVTVLVFILPVPTRLLVCLVVVHRYLFC